MCTNLDLKSLTTDLELDYQQQQDVPAHKGMKLLGIKQLDTQQKSMQL
jgi:hypothetical protein